MKHFPFTVFNKEGKPYVRVEYRGEKKEFVSFVTWASLNRTNISDVVPRRNFLDGSSQNEGNCGVLPWHNSQ